VPSCPNRLVLAVQAVRGHDAALGLLREHLHLRVTAKVVFSTYGDCLFLLLDEIDRFRKQRVGMPEAVATMLLKVSERFKLAISKWTLSDIARVNGAVGIRALAEIGVIPLLIVRSVIMSNKLSNIVGESR